MEEPFVPDAFEVPASFEGPGFQLEPLGTIHNERDHDAWMSSIDHIRSTPGFDASSSWPVAMDLERNREDLAGHAKDFEERTGFTYSVLDGDEVIGCVYIYPSRRPGVDAELRSWVRQSRAGMDPIVWRALSDWIDAEWPFVNPYYAPRD